MLLIYKNLLIFISIITERKSQDTLGLRILYERKLLENKFIYGTENLKTIEETNITINTNLLEMINELSEYYIARDTKHEEINYDLKNLEYMFYSLKNIKTATFYIYYIFVFFSGAPKNTNKIKNLKICRSPAPRENWGGM